LFLFVIDFEKIGRLFSSTSSTYFFLDDIVGLWIGCVIERGIKFVVK